MYNDIGFREKLRYTWEIIIIKKIDLNIMYLEYLFSWTLINLKKYGEFLNDVAAAMLLFPNIKFPYFFFPCEAFYIVWKLRENALFKSYSTRERWVWGDDEWNSCYIKNCPLI